MFEPDKDGVYARISASPIRRGFAYAVLFGLGALLIYLSFVSLAGFAGRLILMALGVLTLAVAEKMRRATQLEIMLTDAGLSDSSGRTLASFDQIESVERGAFALKPSNGFSLVMKTRQPRAWVPGLWWRAGYRVGVGGVTSAGASKFMAEQIAFRLATKDD